eukprot:TRINITY_DN2149_c0_g1_i1.p1 TRINITY_DN2149_c0_g1~~TRINITY_DN2149_c0_g1_i1.p1  ORF type:complete len:347 (+),score=30.11 TRINITY_DN2149_c0_g1_i1:53-1042(+)
MAATATFARSVVSQFVGTSVSTAAKTVSTRAISAFPRQAVRAAPLGLSLELPFAAGQLRPAVLSRNFSQVKAAALDEEFSVGTAEGADAGFDAPPPAPAAPPQGTKLYVGNLPWSVDSESLAEHFQQVGNVDMVEVIYDRETGRSRGFAFVTFATQAEANAAIEQLDGTELGGRNLRVNYPNPTGTRTERTERPPRPAGAAGAGGRRNDPNKLYVGNLSWGMDDLGLEELFAEFGAVSDAKVVTDRDTGRSRGFGFVTMSSAQEVKDAISALDGVEVDGRIVRVNLANAEGAGGGGGRGGGGGFGGGRREGGYGGGGGGGGGYGSNDGW